jgi:predicted ArsR family transcriptional regulator
MEAENLEQQIAGLAALGEPVRRSLYLYVAGQPGDVSREEAAQAVGISRTLAGFHLDRLAKEGLLETSFMRLSGRTGPGAGRPAKLYRRAARQLAVSLPPRSYELAARILAQAIEGAAPQAANTLESTASRIGQTIGSRARARAGSRRGKKRLLADALTQLTALGYEPERGPDEIRLRNCPFHALVNEHRELVCGMNLALIEGVIEGLDLEGVEPVLDPKPGMCCVALRLAEE